MKMSGNVLRKFSGLILVLGFICAIHEIAPAQSRKERQQAERAIADGNKALDQKNFQLAVTKFNEGLTVLPSNAAAHYQKARAHFFLGEYEQAVTEYELALNHGQKPMDVYRNRWAAYEKLKRYEDALGDIGRVLADDPSNTDFLIASADINYEKGAFNEAAEAYLKLAPKSRNSGDVYYKAALARSKAGDAAGQAAAAELAIAKNTQFLADSLVLLGKARQDQKRIPEAIDAFSKALESRPDKPEAYRQLAELYRTQNQLDEGIAILEKGRRQNATNGEIYSDLSLFYSLLEKKDEAVAAGRSAAQLIPNSPAAHINLCRAYFQSGKSELAISSCNRALSLSPEDGEALFYLGRATSEIARRPNAEPRKAAEAERFYQRAVKSLLMATKAKPEDPEGFYMLGNAYADLQQGANAIEAYNKVLGLNPKLTRANFNIGIIQLNGNNKAGAIEQYNVLLLTDKVLADKLKALIDRL